MMKPIFMALAVVSLNVAVVGADFTGTWKANIAESQVRSDLVSQTLTIDEPSPNLQRVTVDVVLKSGQKQHQVIDRICDGKEHPASGVGIQEGLSEICQVIDPSTRTVTQKRDGKVISEFTVNVSPDGKVMTNRRTGGTFAGTTIFEKQ